MSTKQSHIDAFFKKASSKKENQGDKTNVKTADEVSKKRSLVETVSAAEEGADGATSSTANVFQKAKIEAPATTSSGKNEPVGFGDLSKTFCDIEATTKRLVINEYLVNFFVQVIDQSPDDLLPSVYLCLNQIGPTHDGIELGIGESILMKAVASATGRSLQAIKADCEELGDLGKVAQKLMFKPKPLTIKHVFKVFREIALISGKDSIKHKMGKINSLLAACQGAEAKYLVRMLEGKLRIGLAEKSVLIALAGAMVKARKEPEEKIPEAVSTLKAVFNEMPNYDLIVPALLEHGVFEISKYCKVTPGTPLKPMLAHPTKALSEVLNRFENRKFTCEYKYDGERAQIHRLDNGTVRVFSRNSEDMSQKYPDIVEKVKLIVPDEKMSFIMDSEVVAWDPEKKIILPFQVLSTRKRKDVSTSNIAVQVCIFAFDLLYLNGESLLQNSLKERRDLLVKSFKVHEGDFAFASHMDGQSTEEIQTFLEDAVKNNCEGLMVKTLEEESSYEPSNRSRNWLKVKKDYLDGMGDSVDLVVIGAYKGRGKRTGTYGGFLLACYDNETEEYQAICKIGTGFSDSDLETHFKFFSENHVSAGPKSYYRYGEGIKPDVWFEPKQVWEVKAADLSISPVSQAAIGLVDADKGISLRFPRFIRIRDDKNPEQATTSEQIAEMYKNQAILNNDAEEEEASD